MAELELADLETALVGYLSGVLTVRVATRVPNPRPASLVRVGRTGGSHLNMVQERATILIECWAPTEEQAWALARDAHKALGGRAPLEIPGAELSARQLSGPVNYPDPATTSPRYQFTLDAVADLVKETTP